MLVLHPLRQRGNAVTFDFREIPVSLGETHQTTDGACAIFRRLPGDRNDKRFFRLPHKGGDQCIMIEKARQELLRKNGGKYTCPLPEYVQPPIGRY